ncbi:MAG: hypothetical protein GQ532_06245 [Methylomarinum sp.]|nr:hypothetical protein [Methylomarinum sp.]
MVTVGFIVEGVSDKKLIESTTFQCWAEQTYQLKIINPVIDAGGNGNMCSRLIERYVVLLQKSVNPDKIVVLADLDPEKCAPCIKKRKEIIGTQGIDLVIIARKAMESWFLADTVAMSKWTKNNEFYEHMPEESAAMPWDRLQEIGEESIGRGPGTKVGFARKFINQYQFDVTRAAGHPNCPSAKYFVDKLALLAN